jgi:hypothetical protein
MVYPAADAGRNNLVQLPPSLTQGIHRKHITGLHVLAYG